LLAGAVDRFNRGGRRGPDRAPRVPLVSCTTQQVLTEVDAIAESLGRALVLPVRWEATMAAVAELGVDRIVDAGPGARSSTWPATPRRSPSGALP